MPVRFHRSPAGGVEAILDKGEAAVLIQLCRELSDVLPDAPGQDDPVVTRLFPRAYLDPTEEEAESEWQRFSQPELVEGRRQAIETFLRTLAQADQPGDHLELTLSEEESQVWLAVVNDARLALGTRLEVTEDTDPASFDPDDPASAPYTVYWWLGYLEEHLVETLAGFGSD